MQPQPLMPASPVQGAKALPGPSTTAPSGGVTLLPPCQRPLVLLRKRGSPFEGFALVQPFFNAIRQTLAWEDSLDHPEKKQRFFKHNRKEVTTFPFIDEIRDIIQDRRLLRQRNASTAKPFQG